MKFHESFLWVFIATLQCHSLCTTRDPWSLGMSVLDVLLGADAFVNDFVLQKVTSLIIALDKLGGLHCQHSASLIL